MNTTTIENQVIKEIKPNQGSDKGKEDWMECTLGEVVEIISGKNQKKVVNPRGKYPIYGSGGVIGKSDEYLCESGTTIIGRKGTINSPIYVKEKFWNVDTAFGFHPFEILNNRLLYFFCVSFNFKSLDKSTTIPSLAKRDLLQIPFPLPPLPIQRAIVRKIEKLFSSLDSGIADLKKAQDQLVIYRQAVLSASLPQDKKVEISELVEKLSQGWSPKCINKNSTDPNQWAVIKTSAIQASKFLEFENKILPDNLEPREQHEIKTGDILITRAGPRVRVGICCLVRKTRPKLINCDKVYRLELKHNLISGEFFEYAMNTPDILSEIEIMKSGSSDSGLNLTQKAFLKLQIPFTSKEEQHVIVREIESRLSVCDKVEESLTESLEKAQALRQSILKKAFEGKLLSEAEIEQCKREKDYEPASVLLEKIKAEKQK